MPTVEAGYLQLAGKIAAPRAVAGADVMPWRPARGLYLLVEQGAKSPAELVDLPGVAGIWWHGGGEPPLAGFRNNSGLQISYCFLDDDPLQVAARIGERLQRRWSDGDVVPLLAAPFYQPLPFEWDRYLP